MSTGPSNRDRHRNRRRESLALLLSLLMHIVAALLFLIWPSEKVRLGSKELDIELVAPRLAPPIRAGGIDLPGRAKAALGKEDDRRGLGAGEKDHGRDRKLEQALKALQALQAKRAARRSRTREAMQQAALPPWLIPLPDKQKQETPTAAEKKRRADEKARSVDEERSSKEKEALAKKAAEEKQEEQKEDASKENEAQEKRGQKGQRSKHERGEELVREKAPRGEAGKDEQSEAKQAERQREERDREALDAKKRKSRKQEEQERAPKLAVLTTATTAMDDSALFRARQSTSPLRRTTTPRLAMLPEGPSLSALVDSVRQDARLREHARLRALHQSRVRDAAADAALTAVRQRTERAARGRGQSASDAAGMGHSQGVPGQVGGRASQNLGMKFYLSGRRVKTSRVVRPPELIKVPKIQCRVTNPGVTPATVRMLVETSGKVGHLYLKHSSGSKRFDRCALSHTRRMFFKPGKDEAGLPLNVWINVRVEPSLL
jgi:TonB family protein